MYPDCPAAVRVGIGLCCYKLGQFEKARKAFQRVLQVSELVTSFLCIADIVIYFTCSNIFTNAIFSMLHGFYNCS